MDVDVDSSHWIGLDWIACFFIIGVMGLESCVYSKY